MSEPEKQDDSISESIQDPTQFDADQYPQGMKLVAVVLSLILCMFVGSMDNTIVGVAIPAITDEFHNLTDISWYGAAYFMTFGAFQSPSGKMYKYFPLKLSFLASLFIFEIGSLVCGVSQNSTTLIVGRAIAGLGASGLVVGAFTIIGFAAPPAKRPALIGMVSMAYAIAAVLGPIIGGAFTEGVTWRWCFFINLPLGGAAAAAFFFFYKTPAFAKPVQATPREKALQMDFGGIALLMALIISYILAFQYGGQTHAWNSSVVIGLIVGAIAILVTFIFWERWLGDRAMIVGKVASKKHVLVGSAYMFFFAGAWFVVLYYLPLYFESVKGGSPIDAGVHLLAAIIPMAIGLTLMGLTLAKVGIMPLYWVTGGVLTTIGCGLLYMLDRDSSKGRWIGFQIILGFGMGFAFNVAAANVQMQSKPEDLSQATAIVTFAMTIGGAVFVTAAQTGFNNQMLHYIQHHLPGVPPEVVLGTGATQIRQAFTAAQVPVIVQGYTEGLKVAWLITVGACGAATIIGAFGSWKKVETGDGKAVVAAV